MAIWIPPKTNKMIFIFRNFDSASSIKKALYSGVAIESIFASGIAGLVSSMVFFVNIVFFEITC